MPEQLALSVYSIMWLYVFFDLPTGTKKQRHSAARFRRDLLKDGFIMKQYSVYIRPCPSGENAAVHIDRVHAFIPDEGLVSIVKVTDKQFSETLNFAGRKTKPPEDAPVQLELF